MAMLEIADLHAGYDGIEVLHGVNLAVDDGEIVALIGSNGAGKTTTTKAVSGIIDPLGGRITYRDEDISGMAPHEVVKRGIIQVPEDRDLFTGLSVEENLRLGAQTAAAKENWEENVDWVYGLFPRLEERSEQRAGTMSGGEQQMLTLGRALMGDPDLLVLDEPSIGLAPQLVDDMFETIREIHEAGLTVLIIEQNVKQTLSLADRGYVMENGRITMQGAGDELMNDSQVVEAYLGV